MGSTASERPKTRKLCPLLIRSGVKVFWTREGYQGGPRAFTPSSDGWAQEWVYKGALRPDSPSFFLLSFYILPPLIPLTFPISIGLLCLEKDTSKTSSLPSQQLQALPSASHIARARRHRSVETHLSEKDSISIPTVIMPTTQTYNRSPQYSVPRGMTTKSPSKIPLAYPAPYKTTISPAHRGSSTHTSAVPSLVSDSGSTSSDRGSSGGASDVDLLDLLDIKLSHSVKSEPLDRALARQAQT